MSASSNPLQLVDNVAQSETSNRLRNMSSPMGFWIVAVLFCIVFGITCVLKVMKDWEPIHDQTPVASNNQNTDQISRNEVFTIEREQVNGTSHTPPPYAPPVCPNDPPPSYEFAVQMETPQTLRQRSANESSHARF